MLAASGGQWALLIALLAPSLLASPLPMTDYSQLNHDEPTHWTKPATTPTEQQVVKLEPGTTERGAGVDTTSVLPTTLQSIKNKSQIKEEIGVTSESGTTAGDDLVAVGAVESFDKDGAAIAVEGVETVGDVAYQPLPKDEPYRDEILQEAKEKPKNLLESPTVSIGTIKTEVGSDVDLAFRDRLPPAYGTPILEATDNFSDLDPIEKLARNRDKIGGTLGVPDYEDQPEYREKVETVQSQIKQVIESVRNKSEESTGKVNMNAGQSNVPTQISADAISKPVLNYIFNDKKENGTTEMAIEGEEQEAKIALGSETKQVNVLVRSNTPNYTDFFKDQNTDFTSEIASIEEKDDNIVNNLIPSEKEDQFGKEGETTTKGSTDDSNNTEQFFRYDIIEDIRNLFSNDNELNENEVKENQLEDVLGFKGEDKIPTEDTLIVQSIVDSAFESGYQDDEQGLKDERKISDSLVVPTLGEKEANYETPFSEWDRESEEQERNPENIVFQMGNESEIAAMDLNSRGNMQGGSWFLLLLSGNSTIVQKRQKDFAKYLKLNLAARLSLEYDELRVNRVVMAPPRLLVNVSVVPSENDNFDEEFDLNERLFGEEEAPLHKLAETNATLLELSGEEYHVVRFLSLRSAQPMTMEESAVEEATRQVSDKHGDIEYLIYIIVGGPCLTLIIFLIYTLYRLYLLPKNDWPWQRDKPMFSTGPRHHRMNENPFAKPLTVIYSGSFVDRNGPPSGSWLDENYKPEMNTEKVEPSLENPTYGLGSLSKNALSEICEPSVLDSPRFNVRMMGCQPAHLLLPRTPVKKISDIRPSRGLTKGLDNPNYLT